MKNKATSRPTVAQRQAEAARRDRRAAIAERQADRQAGVESVVQQNARLYRNIGR